MARYSVNDNWADTRKTISDCVLGLTGTADDEEAYACLAGAGSDAAWRDLVACSSGEESLSFTRDEFARWFEEAGDAVARTGEKEDQPR